MAFFTGSPTRAESVMNSCNEPTPTKDTDQGQEATGPSSQECPRQNPVPAPGSPVASVVYGPKLTRSNPLYGSLKKVSQIVVELERIQLLLLL